jgi:hypothetical protein
MSSIVWDKKGLKHIDDALATALAKSGYVLQDDIRQEQVIPRMDGTLSGEGFTVDVSTAKLGYIRFTFDTPYARRMYFHPEYHFHREPWVDSEGKKHDGNPNAQGLWMELWMEGGKYEKRPSQILANNLKGKI